MSKIALLRTGVLTAVSALSGLSSADVFEAATVDDVFALAPRTPAVGVVFEGLEATGDPPLGTYDSTPASILVSIVVVAEEWTSSAGAKDDLDSLAEAVRAIRAANVGASLGRPVRLRLVSEAVVEPPNRPETGGPLAVVCRYRSTAFTV